MLGVVASIRSASVRLTGHAPFLLVPDVAAALEHYRDVFGFETSAVRARAGGQRHGDARRVHDLLQPRAEGDPELGARPPDLFDVYLWTDDVQTLFEELRGRGADILHEPIDRPWRMREIRVRDPNGYVLGFGQPL